MKKNQPTIEQQVLDTLDLLETDRYQNNPFLYDKIKKRVDQIENQTKKIVPLFSAPVLLKIAGAVILLILNIGLMSQLNLTQGDVLSEQYGWVMESSKDFNIIPK